MNDFDEAHRQAAYPIRFEWGPVGAEATAASHAVVVDVLSFTTTVTVAAEHGIEVFPYEWRDTRAAEHAMRHGAKLAVGRFEAMGLEGRHISLSPASLAGAEGVARLVLPSPNGSTICFRLAEAGTTVLAAGERWPDGSLRPCVEDLWGAGAVLAALADLGVDGFSPEARMAERAFRSVEPDLGDQLPALAGARELIDASFEADVKIAGELDASDVVPVLQDESFQPG